MKCIPSPALLLLHPNHVHQVGPCALLDRVAFTQERDCGSRFSIFPDKLILKARRPSYQIQSKQTKSIKISLCSFLPSSTGNLFRVGGWIMPTALKIRIWVVLRGQDWALCIAVKDTEQLYNTDSTRLCRKRKGIACWWDMASCPQTDCPPLSFALCKELLASQTQGLFSSITRSVCPTLAGWVQPTSCCGDVCVGACKVGDTDVCVWWGDRARCCWRPHLAMCSQPAYLGEKKSSTTLLQ